MHPACPSCGSRIISTKSVDSNGLELKACHSCGNNFHKGGKGGGGGGLPKPGQGSGAVIPGASQSKPGTIQRVQESLRGRGLPQDAGVAQNTSQHQGRWVVGHPKMGVSELSSIVKRAGGSVKHMEQNTDWKGRPTAGAKIYFNLG